MEIMVWILAFRLQYRVCFMWAGPVKIWKPTDGSIQEQAGCSSDEIVPLYKITDVITKETIVELSTSPITADLI
jgi:hypothetical protein